MFQQCRGALLWLGCEVDRRVDGAIFAAAVVGWGCFATNLVE